MTERKRGAPAGNQNSKKPDSDLADAQVQFRCRPEDKTKWIAVAQKKYGKGKLTEFLKDAANKYAAEILDE